MKIRRAYRFRQSLGRRGENAVIRLLRSKDYRILAHNWKIKAGELDIVALDGNEIVFVEVKTRSCLLPEQLTYGRPSQAVGTAKQRHIITAAKNYLRAHPGNTLQPRIDVIEVYLKKTKEGAPPHLLNIHHIRNAFLAK